MGEMNEQNTSICLTDQWKTRECWFTFTLILLDTVKHFPFSLCTWQNV